MKLGKQTYVGMAVAALAVGWVVFGYANRTSVEEARKLVEQGAVLLDVRTTEEFGAGHIDGALNIPVQQLAARLSEVPKDKPVVLYCRSGNRSARALRMLKEKGFNQVYDIGAMSNWR